MSYECFVAIHGTGNPSLYGWAWILSDGDHVAVKSGRTERPVSAGAAYLWALERAVAAASARKAQGDVLVVVRSDALVKTLSRKPSGRCELAIARVQKILKADPQIAVVWLPSRGPTPLYMVRAEGLAGDALATGGTSAAAESASVGAEKRT